MKKHLYIFVWISVCYTVVSCSDERPQLLESCTELGIEHVQPSPRQAFNALVLAVSRNDTMGAVNSVVSVKEMRSLYPRQIDADTNANSVQVIPQLFHAENMKHLKRVFQDFAGKALDSVHVAGGDEIISHKGFEIIGNFSMGTERPYSKSLVHCREGYKVWAILDRKQ